MANNIEVTKDLCNFFSFFFFAQGNDRPLPDISQKIDFLTSLKYAQLLLLTRARLCPRAILAQAHATTPSTPLAWIVRPLSIPPALGSVTFSTRAMTSQHAKTLATDSLMNLNERSAKHSVWVVRVANSRVLHYKFMARGETVDATKFICHLVGEKSTEYIVGIVPFDFKNKSAAEKAMRQYPIGQVMMIRSPAFDQRSTAKFLGCSKKVAVALQHPTIIKLISAPDPLAALPAMHPEPILKLADVLKLKETRAVDFACIVKDIGSVEQRTVNGVDTVKMAVEVFDDSRITPAPGSHDEAEIAKATLEVRGVHSDKDLVGSRRVRREARRGAKDKREEKQKRSKKRSEGNRARQQREEERRRSEKRSERGKSEAQRQKRGKRTRTYFTCARCPLFLET